MLVVLLLAQLALGDSVYSTPELKQFVEAAATANREPPISLAGYSTRAESDMALLLPDAHGVLHATQLEQAESRLQWWRSGRLEQHVIGYRERARGMTVSALSVLHHPWVVPALFGDTLRFGLDLPRVPGLPALGNTALAVHPLGRGREQVYRYSGGDTVVNLHLPGRTIPVVRVHVEPQATAEPQLLFRGDLDITADRKQLIRLHGTLEAVQAHAPLMRRLRRSALQTAVELDVVEAEFEGRYWLPVYERFQVAAGSRLSTTFRPTARIVTTFREQVVDTAKVEAADTSGDEARLTFAPRDSLDRFHGWMRELGSAATEADPMDSGEAARVTPASGTAPSFVWGAERLSDVFRFDKVEGLYTGVAGTLQPSGPAATGLSMVIHAGWAWSARTAFGAADLRRETSRGTLGFAVSRELENTNDFIPTLEGPATLTALFATIDDFDYVDRAGATAFATHVLDARGRRLLRFELGPGRDASVRTNLSRGLIQLDSVFRPNRPVAEGTYLREAVALAINPQVSGEFLEPGIGLVLSYERGDGGLRWQRLDARLSARHGHGPITYRARVDAAALFGGAPPQRVIEFGGNEGLPGYGYKEFGGDRAILVRLGGSYLLPYLRAPLRLHRWLALPAPAPALTVGLHSGWAAAVQPTTREALASFGLVPDPSAPATLLPITRPTGGLRTTAGISLDLFGGGLGIGVARPVDRPGGWVLLLGSAQAW